MTANEIRDRLIKHRIATIAEMRGCTLQEVEELERHVGKPLPRAYKQFLFAVGHGAGALLRGTDVFLGYQVHELTPAAQDLLAENGLKSALPDDAFVFYMHQGYIFGYFLLGEGDDPPVYEYGEGTNRLQLGWASFTDYLNDQIRIHAKA